MELAKNHPWAKELKAPKESFQKWRAEAGGESFAFWSLKNRLISPKLYFDWAVEHYQIPFLQDIFFEQYLMKQKQWEKIKDLSDWTKELLPVALWGDSVFIGCVEPPADREKTFPFKHRFVLANSSVLQITWKFTQELSRSIQKETQTNFKAQAPAGKEPLEKPFLQTNSKIKSDKGLGSQAPHLSAQRPSAARQAAPSTSWQTHSRLKAKSSIEAADPAFTPEIPLEKKQPSAPPFIQSAALPAKKAAPSAEKAALSLVSGAQQAPSAEKAASSAEKAAPSEKKAALSLVSGDKAHSADSKTLKAESSFPETEEARAAEADNHTFPGRSPAGEDNNLIMADFRRKAPSRKSPSIKKPDSPLDQENGVEITVSSAGLSQLRRNAQDRNYELLWKQTQPVFCSAMILKVQEGKLYLSVWRGRLKAEGKDEELMDLKELSLFKVVQKGIPYHGFVVDIPANKKFFSKIGWDSYPKHVTAIPIQSIRDKSLQQVFMGLSMSQLSKDKIKKIEKTVSDFFQSQRGKMAA